MYAITLLESGFNDPIKNWLPVEEIEPGALEQLHNAAKHPEVGPAVAVMPDCHVGYGVTIVASSLPPAQSFRMPSV